MTVADRQSVLSRGDKLGCYRIENFLGQGGFGVTYLARDTMLDMQVAIKEYMPESIASRANDNSVRPKTGDEGEVFTWGLSRFIKEAQTLARFKHPNIVRVMTVFEQNGTAYMVMEYERGLDLKAVFSRPGNNSEEFLKRLIGPIIDGLDEVHRHGYIHRDIKPANILIREDGSPVLLDFGSARQATGAQTQALTALVSVGFAPLEQYNGADDQQGPWTDVYALGAVLYYAITGNAPLDSTLRGSAVLNDRADPLKALSVVNPEGYTREFCEAVDWALRFKVADRPQTLSDWRGALFDDDRTVLMPGTARVSKSVSMQQPASNSDTAGSVQQRRQKRQTRQTGKEPLLPVDNSDLLEDISKRVTTDKIQSASVRQQQPAAPSQRAQENQPVADLHSSAFGGEPLTGEEEWDSSQVFQRHQRSAVEKKDSAFKRYGLIVGALALLVTGGVLMQRSFMAPDNTASQTSTQQAQNQLATQNSPASSQTAESAAESIAEAEKQQLAAEEAQAAQAQRALEERRAAEVERVAQQRREAEEAGRIARAQQEAAEAQRIAQEKRDAAEAQRLAQEQQEAAEAQRLAREQQEAAEAQRLAREQQEAAEAQRLAQEQQEAAEAQRLAQEQQEAAEAQRIAGEQQQAAEEAERVAKEQREAARAERLAQEKREAAQAQSQAEEERRLAQEKAEAAEAARVARVARVAEEQRKADAEARLAEEERLKEEQARQAAAVQRQARERQQAAQAAKLAEERRLARIEADKAETTDSVSGAEASRLITDSDISQVLQQFNALKRAIEGKDLSFVKAITFDSERKYSYFSYVFGAFDKVEAQVTNVRASRRDQTIRASLRIKRMIRSNGDIVPPPAEFEAIPLHSVRSNAWSKIHW